MPCVVNVSEAASTNLTHYCQFAGRSHVHRCSQAHRTQRVVRHYHRSTSLICSLDCRLLYFADFGLHRQKKNPDPLTSRSVVYPFYSMLCNRFTTSRKVQFGLNWVYSPYYRKPATKGSHFAIYHQSINQSINQSNQNMLRTGTGPIRYNVRQWRSQEVVLGGIPGARRTEIRS